MVTVADSEIWQQYDIITTVLTFQIKNRLFFNLLQNKTELSLFSLNLIEVTEVGSSFCLKREN